MNKTNKVIKTNSLLFWWIWCMFYSYNSLFICCHKMQTTTASLNWIIFYNSCLCRWWSQLPFFFTASHSQLKIQTQLLVFQKFHINDHEKSVEIAIDLIMIRLLFAFCIHHIALENRKMEMCNVIRYKRCSSMKNLHSIQRELRKSVFASNFPFITCIELCYGLSCSLSSTTATSPRLCVTAMIT